MDDDGQRRLLEGLRRLQGMVVLCGYHHPLYDSLGWPSLTREAHADGARDRTEVLWFNPKAWERKPQAELFGGIA
jgi:DNA adenine methylase